MYSYTQLHTLCWRGTMPRLAASCMDTTASKPGLHDAVSPCQMPDCPAADTLRKPDSEADGAALLPAAAAAAAGSAQQQVGSS